MMKRFRIPKVPVPLSICAVLILADVALSLWGEGPDRRQPNVQNINLGYQPDYNVAQITALHRLSKEVLLHPDKQVFYIRWVGSFLFGWYNENQYDLWYDRKNRALVESDNSPELKEPMEEWDNLPSTLLPGLAEAGFNSGFLEKAGARSDLRF
jgi:hypothetical protein